MFVFLLSFANSYLEQLKIKHNQGSVVSSMNPDIRE